MKLPNCEATSPEPTSPESPSPATAQPGPGGRSSSPGTPLTWAEHLPMVLSEVEVTEVQRLSPSFVRIVLAGPGLEHVGPADSRWADPGWWDQRFKLVVPHVDGGITSVADADQSWLSTWTARPASERGHMRTYTVRELRGTGPRTRLAVDVVVHAEGEQGAALGPGARWAQEARPGTRAVALLPRRGHAFGGIEFQPLDAARLLLVGDETAVPAICAILEHLPGDRVGAAFLEVPLSADVLNVVAPPGVEVHWLPRDGAPHGERLQAAVHAYLGIPTAALSGDLPGTDLPDTDLPGTDEVDPELWETPTYSSSGEPLVDAEEGGPVPGEHAPSAGTRHAGLYAWIAGESAVVTALRRHLVTQEGVDRSQVSFMGYWRRGVAMKS